MTWAEVQATARDVLPGVRYRRHLLVALLAALAQARRITPRSELQEAAPEVRAGISSPARNPGRRARGPRRDQFPRPGTQDAAPEVRAGISCPGPEPRAPRPRSAPGSGPRARGPAGRSPAPVFGTNPRTWLPS